MYVPIYYVEKKVIPEAKDLRSALKVDMEMLIKCLVSLWDDDDEGRTIVKFMLMTVKIMLEVMIQVMLQILSGGGKTEESFHALKLYDDKHFKGD